jgi:hypothetical protein
MADPFSAVLNAMLGGVLQGAGLIAETEADNAAMELASREWQRAMRTVEAQRVDALVQGGQQAGQLRTRTSQIQGQQRLAFASSNVDASSGTAAQTQDSTGFYGELDAQTAKNNARRVALGHSRVEQQLLEEAKQAQLARKNRDTARVLRAFSIPLNAGASALSNSTGGK